MAGELYSEVDQSVEPGDTPQSPPDQPQRRSRNATFATFATFANRQTRHDDDEDNVLTDEGIEQLQTVPRQCFFLFVLILLQSRIFNIEAVLDVHFSLVEDLGLEDESFTGIVDDDGLFKWLSESLVPAVSGESKGGRIQPVDATTQECISSWDEPTEAVVSQCAACDQELREQETPAAAPGPGDSVPPGSASAPGANSANGPEELIFVDAYTVLFSGITVRQAAHCSLASLDSRTGELRSQSWLEDRPKRSSRGYEYLPCIESSLFDSKVTKPRTARLPPRGCYKSWDMATFADTQPGEYRPWITSATVEKEVFFLPCSSTSATATAAAQAILSEIQKMDWLDATTAEVYIQFMVLSHQYGLLTEVEIAVSFPLGGSTNVDYDMRSVSGNVLSNSSYSVCDVCFILLFLWPLAMELQEMATAAQYPEDKIGGGHEYTSVCVWWCRPTTWFRGCVRPKRRSELSAISHEVFNRHATIGEDFDGDNVRLLSRREFKAALRELGIRLTEIEMAEAIEKNPSYDDDAEWEIDEEKFAEFVQEQRNAPYLSDPWNILDWCRLLVHGSACWLLVFSINQPTPAFEHLVATKLPDGADDGSHSWEMHVSRWTHNSSSMTREEPPLPTLEELSGLIKAIHTMQYTCAVLLILQAMVFLRIAKGYARLGIVTQTLAYAKSELLHFTLIFFFILWIYAQAGHFLYGADMPEFAGVMTSFQSCFDILLGGGDFERMQAVAKVGTLIYYWSLVVLGVMIGMNIIITILMSGFERANKVMDSAAPPFSDFLLELIRQCSPKFIANTKLVKTVSGSLQKSPSLSAVSTAATMAPPPPPSSSSSQQSDDGLAIGAIRKEEMRSAVQEAVSSSTEMIAMRRLLQNQAMEMSMMREEMRELKGLMISKSQITV